MKNNQSSLWQVIEDARRNIVQVALFVTYFGRLVAIVNDLGKIIWRDTKYPMFLVEYLIEDKDHKCRWN